jgi:hypothetical protein
MKSYDVHTVVTYSQLIEANSAREAKRIVEDGDHDGAAIIAGPDVVAVLEVTDGAVL